MTTKQYLAALKKLGLTPHSKVTAAALGLSLRKIQKMAAGGTIPAHSAIILRLHIDHKIPIDQRRAAE